MQSLKGSGAGSFLILSASDGSFAQPRGMAFLGEKKKTQALPRSHTMLSSLSAWFMVVVKDLGWFVDAG